MKLLLAVLLLSSSLFAAQHEEVLVIEELIATTKKNLNSQEELLRIVHDYNAARDNFIADPDSGKKATLLVKRAMRLQAILDRDRLSHLFPSDFVTELTFFNQVGKHQLASE